MEFTGLFSIRSRGENILCRSMYLSANDEWYSVPPLSHYQQEIEDVNQGDIGRGLLVVSEMYLPLCFVCVTEHKKASHTRGLRLINDISITE